jgi:hypothetical protein
VLRDAVGPDQKAYMGLSRLWIGFMAEFEELPEVNSAGGSAARLFSGEFLI